MRVVRIYHSAVVRDWRERDRLLRAAGDELTLVSPRRWNEGGRVVRLVDPEAFVRASSTLGRHPYRFVFGPGPILGALRRRPDVVDIHEEPGSLAAFEVLVLRWFSGAWRSRVVFYSAQNIFKRYPIPFRWFEAAMFRAASAAYVCNEEAKRILERKGFAGEIRVIPLGIDAHLFEPRDTASTDRPFTVGYAGRLEEHKGIAVLLGAIARLDGTSLRIVGEGPDRERLVALADDLNLNGRVAFDRFASRDEIADFYREIDVLAVPSLPRPNWLEQFGRVAAEAMSVGTPVVASASGSLPEVVGPGGLLVPPGDEAALAAALESLRDDGRRAELGAAASAWASRFRWDEVARQHRALYEAVVA